MANRKAKLMSRIAGVLLYLVAAVLVPLNVGCGADTCTIFNCETLFFIEDLAASLQGGTGEEGHDDGEEGEEHNDAG